MLAKEIHFFPRISHVRILKASGLGVCLVAVCCLVAVYGWLGVSSAAPHAAAPHAAAPHAAAQAAKKTELAASGWGSLKGTVHFEGALPKLRDLRAEMQKHADGPKCCLLGDKKEIDDPVWVIDPKTKALANVIIWLRAPSDKYFPIHADDKVRKDTVELDQPHCAFVPHVLAHYPEYYDGNKTVPTGQKFVVKNSATVPHNVRFAGFKNTGFNTTIAPKGSMPVELTPEKLPLTFQCDFHKWMSARVAVFDHPYFAITKEDGTFVIPRVPAAEVTVIGWHEEVGYVFGPQAMNLQPGENVLNFKLKK